MLTVVAVVVAGLRYHLSVVVMTHMKGKKEALMDEKGFELSIYRGKEKNKEDKWDSVIAWIHYLCCWYT